MRRVIPLVLITLLLGTVGYGIYYFYPKWFPEDRSALTKTLTAIDQVIALGGVQEALKLIESAFPNAKDVDSRLSLLKRLLKLGQVTNDWVPAKKHIQLALNETPGNSRLLLLRYYADLRSGLPKAELEGDLASLEASLKIIPLPEPQKNFYANLRKEGALLELSRKWGGAENWNNPDYLLERYQITSETGLLNDAALLFLKAGDYGRAAELFAQPVPQEDPVSDEIQALLYFDTGDYARCLYFLNRINNRINSMPLQEFLSLQADVLLITGRLDEAEILFRKTVSDFPKASVSSRVNLALLALFHGDVAAAKAELDHLPTLDFSTGLLKTEIDFLAGEALSGARANLKAALLKSPFAEAEVLRMRLYPDTFSLPRLWVLFNREKANPAVAEYLTYSEMAAENYDKARKVMAEFRTRQDGGAWWLDYYEGLILGLTRQWSEAAKVLNRVPEKWRSPQYYFNRGLIATMDLERPDTRDDAIGHFSKALELLPQTDTPETRRERSSVHASRGLLHLIAGRKVLAVSDLQKAAELDSENLKARLLLKKAEELK